jgi:hypothetical protein
LDSKTVVVTAISAALLVGLAAPVVAAPEARNTQISGQGVIAEVGVFPEQCPEPEGYEDFFWLTIELTEGNLQGCWYTLVEQYSFSPNADASPVVYQERGREVFVGDFYDDNGDLVGGGTFETTYKFTGKYEDASLFVEIHGRCQHPLVSGSGTGVFEDATGRVDFKDDVTTGDLYYRGHIKLTNGA